MPPRSRMRTYDRIAFAFTNRARSSLAARILDGTKIAAEIRAEGAAEVKALALSGLRPGLAVVLVGHNPASEVYVRGKVKVSQEVGIYSEKHTPPETATTEELLELIADLNRRDEINGILVQLPLPPQVDAKKVLLAVDPAKDVDGFHPMNVGFLETERDSRSGTRSRSRGAQRHRRQTSRDAPPECECDRDRLPLQNPRSPRSLPTG